MAKAIDKEYLLRQFRNFDDDILENKYQGKSEEMTEAQYNALTPAEKSDGTIRFITDKNPGGGGGSTVSIAETGTASSTTIRSQKLTIDSVATDINGTKYMQQTITLSTSASVTATFTNEAITASSIIEVFAGRSNGDDTEGGQNEFPHSSMTTTVTSGVGTCEITFPRFTETINLDVVIYIR